MIILFTSLAGGEALVWLSSFLLQAPDQERPLQSRAAAARMVKSVRDVHPETFIKAYAAHLKANDKVSLHLTSPSVY